MRETWLPRSYAIFRQFRLSKYPVLVDSHAHLYLDAFAADRDAVVDRAHAAGVTRILQPAVDVASIDAALALCDRYPGVLAMAGLHPTYVADAAPDALGHVERHLGDPRVVAVGETGLDYYWSRDAVEVQHASLRAHIRLAIRYRMPIVMHLRDRAGSSDCADDLVRLLREERAAHPDGDTLTGVVHCFGGPASLAADVLGLGLCLGLGGSTTFKTAGVMDAVADVPLDRLVLETDAPYLAPVPHRGTRNEPAYVRLVAERVADARGLTVDAVAEATTATATRLFNLE